MDDYRLYKHYVNRDLLDFEPMSFSECRRLQKLEAEYHKKHFRHVRYKGGGKSGGKLIGAILLGALTAVFAGAGILSGLAASTSFATGFANFMLGASLFSTIWTALQKPQGQSMEQADINVNRFDKAQETASSEAMIPIVYGERRIAGNQTWHETNGGAQTLRKHVVLCEGGIEGVKSVTANELILPTNRQQSNTVFVVQNTKYSNATFRILNKYIYLSAGGKTHNIYLYNKEDAKDDGEHGRQRDLWSYQVSTSALVSYINSLHNEGWQAFPYAATTSYPGDLYNVYTNTYSDAQQRYFKRKALAQQIAALTLQAYNQGYFRFDSGLLSPIALVIVSSTLDNCLNRSGWFYRKDSHHTVKVTTLPPILKQIEDLESQLNSISTADIPDYYLCEGHEYSSGNSKVYYNAGGVIAKRIIQLQLNKIPNWLEPQKGPVNCYLKPVDVRAPVVSGGSKYTFYDCVTPSNYTTVGGYPKMAWLDLTFTTQSEFSGNPTVSCVVRGRKIYDVRTKTTAYSTNPAMCLRDFLLSKRYGLGKWFTAEMLDDESWTESANYCDEIITFRDGSGALVKAKRYELNMVIDQKRSGLEWVQEMLACFAGFLVYSDGKLKLRIEKPTPVSYKFTDSNCSDLKISPLKLSETPNKYEVTIIDPLNNWTSVKALCEDYADQKLRQRIVTKSVSLEGVTSQNQALRLARFYRDYNLVCPMQIGFTTGMQAMHLEPGDVVTVSYHGVFKEMPIRIAEIKETSKGTFEIAGRQYNETIYGDELGGGVHWYNYSQMDSPLTDDVPNVKNLSLDEDSYIDVAGTYFGHITVKWDAPAYQFLSGYDVYYRFPDNTDSWTFLGNTPDTEYVINNIPKLAKIDVLVRTVNTYNRKSDGAEASITTSGKNSPPGPVTKFVAGQYGNEMRFVFSGVMPSDPDIAGAEIRRDGRTWDDAIPVVTVSMLPYTLENQDFDDGTHMFRIKAFDTVGNYSEESTFTLTVRDINEFKNIILERDDIALRTIKYGNGFVYNDEGHLITVWGMRFSDLGDMTFSDIEDVTWRTGGTVYCDDGRLIKVWWMKFNDLRDMTFGDIGDVTWMVGGAFSAKPELRSPIIDTWHADLTSIRYVFDISLVFDEPIWGDIWDRTFKDVQGQTFFTLYSKSTYDIFIRYSNDNQKWTDWQFYLAATYQFRYIQYKIVFNAAESDVSARIKSLKQYYDVPDFTLSTRGTTVDGYTRVNFGKVLYKIPTQMSFIVTDVGAVVSPVVIPTTTYVDIYTYNASGETIDVNFLLTVNGY